MFPATYGITNSHCFHTGGAYKCLAEIVKAVIDKLSVIVPLIPSVGQIYKWLRGEEKQLKMKIDGLDDISDRDRKGIFDLWASPKIGARAKCLMWRTAMGGLKTGSFINKYNIPGMNVACQFCGHKLETTRHLFSECIKLETVREGLKSFASMLGVTLCDEKLFFCTGFAPEANSRATRTSLFSAVAEVWGVVWNGRCDALFRGGVKEAIAKVTNFANAILARRRKEFLDESQISA